MESDIFFERGSPHHCPKKGNLCFNIIALKFYLSIKSIRCNLPIAITIGQNSYLLLLYRSSSLKVGLEKTFFKEGGILLSLKQGKSSLITEADIRVLNMITL